MQKWGLLFDLDDTLFDSSSAYAFALSAIDINPLGSPYLTARANVKRRLGEGHVAARNRLLYFKELLVGENRYTHSLLMTLMDKYESALTLHIQKQWMGLNRVDLFSSLDGVPRVILTNENTRTQTLKLKAIDPSGEIFPSVLTSEDLGCEKPNPKLLLAGIARLGLPPSQCLVVGDSLESDILPALKLGCPAILITEFKARPKDIPSSVSVLSKLDELPEWLQ